MREKFVILFAPHGAGYTEGVSFFSIAFGRAHRLVARRGLALFASAYVPSELYQARFPGKRI